MCESIIECANAGGRVSVTVVIVRGTVSLWNFAMTLKWNTRQRQQLGRIGDLYMLRLKNFSGGPLEQRAELLEILEAEQALGWTTVSEPFTEQDEILSELVNVIYEMIREAENEEN